MPLGLKIFVSVVMLVAVVLAAVFTIVFRVMRRSVERLRSELDAEGVVLDSGVRRATIRYRDFHSPGYYDSLGVKLATLELVLTHRSMVVLGAQRWPRVPLEALHRYVVEKSDNALLIKTDQPVGATGHTEIRIRVDDPDAWARALQEAGAAAPSP